MLNKNNLTIAALAGCEPSRYPLNTVRVTQAETMVTDGHRLIIVTHPKAEEGAPLVESVEPTEAFEPFLIPAPLALEVADSLAKSDKVKVSNGRRKSKTVKAARQAAIDKSVSQNGHVALGIADRQGGERVFKLPKVGGTYPEISKAIPAKSKAVVEVSLNLHLLIPLLQQILKCNPGWRKSSEVRIRVIGPNAPVRLDARNSETGQEITAVIMPVRGDDSL